MRVLDLRALCGALVLLLLLVLPHHAVSGEESEEQRPVGWVSGFTKDGREYWYHPDNPRDVRTKPPLKKKAKSPAAATLAAPLLTSV